MMGDSARSCRAHTNLGCSLVWGSVIAVSIALALANLYMSAPMITTPDLSQDFTFEPAEEPMDCRGKGVFRVDMKVEDMQEVFGSAILETEICIRASCAKDSDSQQQRTLKARALEEGKDWLDCGSDHEGRRFGMSVAGYIAITAKNGTILGKVHPPDRPTGCCLGSGSSSQALALLVATHKEVHLLPLRRKL
jgi:hypothetical protein